MIFEVGIYDPWTFFVVALVLAVAATLATYLPAIRAASIDPLIALRDDA